MKNIIRNFVKKLQGILVPHHNPRSLGRKRQSRLLSLLILSLIVVGLMMILSYTLFSDPPEVKLNIDFFLSIAGLLLLLGGLILNYFAPYRVSAVFIVLVMTVFIFITAIPTESHDEVEMLYFTLLPILFSSVLLSFTFTVFLAFAIILGMVLFTFVVPGVQPEQIPLFTITITSLLLIFTARYRELVEWDRRKVLSDSEERFRTLVMNAPEAILLYNADEKRFIEANQNAENLFVKSRNELLSIGFEGIHKLGNDLQEPPLSEINENIDLALKGETPFFEWQHNRKTGNQVVCEVRLVQLPAQDQNLLRVSFTDITKRKSTEKRLRYLATHDALTGLPNRALFEERLDYAIQRGTRNKSYFAVLFLDIDNFKDVNDAFDHSCGDYLLQEVARRLSSCLRKSDMIARRGGDEFTILIEDLSEALAVIAVLHKIRAKLGESITIEQREIYITISIGISVYPDNGETVQALLRNADAALFHAKEGGKDTYAFYSGEISQAAYDHISLASDLRYALERNELFILYQPQVRLPLESITGFEALLRWRHPERGTISPGLFIPIAEETGLIVKIGEWVLREACLQAVRWNRKFGTNYRIAVNLSGRQLFHSKIVDTVERVLAETGLPPHLLEIELTENILFTDFDESQRLLGQIKELGVRLAIDDFGTGFSTLRQLAQFPVNVLKIDQHFARHIGQDDRDAAVVSGLITIAKNLRMETTGEGIEDEEQLALYRDLGCNIIQGYYYSKPLSAAECSDYLKRPRQFEDSLQKQTHRAQEGDKLLQQQEKHHREQYGAKAKRREL